MIVFDLRPFLMNDQLLDNDHHLPLIDERLADQRLFGFNLRAVLCLDIMEV